MTKCFYIYSRMDYLIDKVESLQFKTLNCFLLKLLSLNNAVVCC